MPKFSRLRVLLVNFGTKGVDFLSKGEEIFGVAFDFLREFVNLDINLLIEISNHFEHQPNKTNHSSKLKLKCTFVGNNPSDKIIQAFPKITSKIIQTMIHNDKSVDQPFDALVLLPPVVSNGPKVEKTNGSFVGVVFATDATVEAKTCSKFLTKRLIVESSRSRQYWNGTLLSISGLSSLSCTNRQHESVRNTWI
jgi:hypothetical protein